MYKNIILLVFVLIFSSSCLKSNKEIKVVNIGYQKSGILFYLKHSKILDDDLDKRGIKVSWIEFPSGPPELEALNSGGIDFAEVGNTPPIFVQSSGKDIVYLATSGNFASSEGILVLKNSNIKGIKDLKGKKIALAKGSSAHYTLIRILQKAGLKFSDIAPVYLQPFDARLAFEHGSVDAWSIWDPYFSGAQLQLGARILQDSTFIDDVKSEFYLSRSNFVKNHEYLIKIIINSIAKINKKVKENNTEFSLALSKLTSLPISIVNLVVSHWYFDVNLIKDQDIVRQQEIADLFFNLKLIPNHIDIKNYVWYPNDFKIEK